MRASFYTVEQLGERQATTPEGFLLCQDVPVARTGEMLYSHNEVPVTPGADGVIKIIRDEQEVFRDSFMASLNGKPIVDDHPDGMVGPHNWSELSGGVMMNVRRGEGLLNDCLIADLLVTNSAHIAAVRSGKREVSLGYTADYEELAPGIGRQANMLGNHIALVAAGRCGSRCAIGDHKQEITSMATKDGKPSIYARLRAALATKDEAAMTKALDEAEKETADDGGEGGEVHVHVGGTADAALESRLKATEDTLAKLTDGMGQLTKAVSALDAKMSAGTASDEEAKKAEEAEDAAAEEEAGTKDARTVKDSAPFADSFQSTLAAAEILVPGITLPTFDSKQPRKATMDALCRLRRSALDLAYNTPDGRGLIEQVNGRVLALDTMTCSQVRTLFGAASAAKRVSNNVARTSDTTTRTTAGAQVKGSVRSIADLNALNAARYTTNQTKQ